MKAKMIVLIGVGVLLISGCEAKTEWTKEECKAQVNSIFVNFFEKKITKADADDLFKENKKNCCQYSRRGCKK